jgi:hypothetical protein
MNQFSRVPYPNEATIRRYGYEKKLPSLDNGGLEFLFYILCWLRRLMCGKSQTLPDKPEAC